MESLPARERTRRLAKWGGIVTALAVAEGYNGSVSKAAHYVGKTLTYVLSQTVESMTGTPLWSDEGAHADEKFNRRWSLPTKNPRGGAGSPERPVPAGHIGSGSTISEGGGGAPRAKRETWDTESESSSTETPNFFASTKFFACLDLEESQELFSDTVTIGLRPHEVLFRAGDDSESGIFVVLEGSLGVFLIREGEAPRHTNTLREGESVGDFDVLDGEERSITCMAMEDGAMLLQVSRTLFMRFIHKRPRALQLYLQQGIARLWRVAHFTLNTVLQLDAACFPHPLALHGDAVSAADTGLVASEWWPLLAGYGMGTQGGEAASPLHAVDEEAASPLHAVAEEAGGRWAGGEAASPAAAAAPTTGDGEEGVQAAAAAGAPRRGSYGGGAPGELVVLARGQALCKEGERAGYLFVLLRGSLLVDPLEPPTAPAPGATLGGPGGSGGSRVMLPGSILGAAAFFSGVQSTKPARALERSELLAVGAAGLEHLLAVAPGALIHMLLAGARALGPLIRSFICLGLNRVWLRAGDTAFKEGDAATSVYITISGRLRLARPAAPSSDPAGAVVALSGVVGEGALGFGPAGVGLEGLDAESGPPGYPMGIGAGGWGGGAGAGAGVGGGHPGEGTDLVVEEEVGRGQAVGAVWVLTSGLYDTTALCVRDSELVRMSRNALEVITSKSPRAAAQLLAAMARRLGARERAQSARLRSALPSRDIATIAVQPIAGCSMDDIAAWAASLKTTLSAHGPTLLLHHDGLALTFRDGTGERLHRRFYRSKFTAWLAEMEETYNFIVLVADATATSWTRICLAQADCTLLVADAGASPEVSAMECQLHWDERGHRHATPTQRALHRQRRVELVLLHGRGGDPSGTRAWLAPRPGLLRHHHVRRGDPEHMARLGRWLAGQAVGLVLSGGGSRGLAHLGVLRALNELGVPVDVVGGTSQGAFMSALYAQQLGIDRMTGRVKHFAKNLGSVPQMMTDLTFPLLSVFTGAGLDGVVRESLGEGAQHLEDLWLRFFCVCTSLTRGCATVHTEGLLWKLVRASMGIVGLVPPVYHHGELLVDGGYTSNIPVDVMRGMGVETVIVVDVEDKDQGAFRDIDEFEGGVSGWRLLLEKLLPARWRRLKLPRYSQIVSQLTFLSHVHQLRAVVRDHPIDLYLRPTGISTFKRMLRTSQKCRLPPLPETRRAPPLEQRE